MAHKFHKGLYSPVKAIPPEAYSRETKINSELFILVLLFILLAASPSLGLESRYFFTIIMAVIGMGGIDKAFGTGGR